MIVSDHNRPGYSASHRGFSIVDLLVSLAVMSLLIAVLLPSLSRVQEAAFRTKSASNIRQQGLALQMYAFDRQGDLPTSAFRTLERHGTDAPEQMVYLRIHPSTAEGATGRAAPKNDAPGAPTTVWDGMGKLVHYEYINQGQVFYNPSHDYIHTYDRYEAQFAGAVGEIVCNYHYRWDANTRRIDQVHNLTALVADAMRSQPEYNHVVGNNMLKGDMSVTWYHDAQGELYKSLAQTVPMLVTASGVQESRDGVLNGWKLLDNTSVERGTATDSSGANGLVGAALGLHFEMK